MLLAVVSNVMFTVLPVKLRVSINSVVKSSDLLQACLLPEKCDGHAVVPRSFVAYTVRTETVRCSSK